MNIHQLYSIILILFIYISYIQSYDIDNFNKKEEKFKFHRNFPHISSSLQVSSSSSLINTIHQRLESLIHLSDSIPILSYECNHSNLIVITEIPFGNSGNNLIELTHGLWIAKQYNYTLNIPIWMRHILHPFNTSILQSKYCYNEVDSWDTSITSIIEITSEESFFLMKLFDDPKHSIVLPKLSMNTIQEISEHFIHIYSLLWSQVNNNILLSSLWLLENTLSSNLSYITIHKRNFEGGCNKVLATQSQVSDYPIDQLPMDDISWQGNLFLSHPICEMHLSFIQKILNKNHFNNSLLYLAYDGRGDISDYIQYNVSLASKLDANIFPSSIFNHMKYIDMFMAINSQVFILNPYSTFSFQIYVLRICLELNDNIPLMKDRDVYFRKGDVNTTSLWVSWISIAEAYQRIRLKESHHDL